MKKGQIVKLTLQPLIENAIEHGFCRRRKEGNIWVKGKQKEGRNYIYVIDDGEGISDEKMTVFQNQMNKSAINEECHIGLRNVNQRIKLIFGDEFGLTLSRADTGGLCVIITYR